MASQFQTITVEEFDRHYADQKPYYEFWYGQAIQKTMPTKLHSALQMILGFLLKELGLIPFSELRLMLDRQAQLLPDVAGFSKPFSGPYPTDPFEVAIEILSPSDSMHYLLRKCRRYAEWKVQNIFVFDPEDRTAFRWNNETGSLESISQLEVTGYRAIPVHQIWSELDRYIGVSD